MTKKKKDRIHIYAVIRLDPDVTDLEFAVTIKEVFPTLAEAESEVGRLNQLARDRGLISTYIWQTTRLRTDAVPRLLESRSSGVDSDE